MEQFHHRGYVSTDPRILPAEGVGLDRPADVPEELDVLIVGTGPAGMITAAAVMPGAALVAWWHPAGPLGLAALWAACNLLFLAVRAIALGIRVRGDAWMRTGG